MVVEKHKTLGFVDRRRSIRRSVDLRGVERFQRVVPSKVMLLDDWLQAHMPVCYVLISIGILRFFLGHA
jgi:hypothetical protein